MNTNSQLKNGSLPASPMAVPDFASWSQVVLAKFAQESSAKMQAQEAEIEQLRQDLKMALNAYREVLKK
jgi:hypothetical protein